jgi:hypothetical protein
MNGPGTYLKICLKTLSLPSLKNCVIAFYPYKEENEVKK